MPPRHSLPAALVCLVLPPLAAWAQEAPVSIRSAHDVPTTVAKFRTAVAARGFGVVAEVDHAAAAEKVGARLRPTTLLIFGNPKGGSPIMACNQKAALDLPLRALVRQAENGATFVEYHAPAELAARYAMADCAAAQIAGATRALQEAAGEATQ